MGCPDDRPLGNAFLVFVRQKAIRLSIRPFPAQVTVSAPPQWILPSPYLLPQPALMKGDFFSEKDCMAFRK
jgi:hypothetical protein